MHISQLLIELRKYLSLVHKHISYFFFYKSIKIQIIEMQIKNEIEKAFSNNTIRTMFVKTLIDELTKLFTDNKIPKEKWNILFDEVAIRIVKYFGVKPKIKEKIGNEIIRFSQEKGLDIFVKASVKDESITLGTDFNLVNNFNI